MWPWDKISELKTKLYDITIAFDYMLWTISKECEEKADYLLLYSEQTGESHLQIGRNIFSFARRVDFFNGFFINGQNVSVVKFIKELNKKRSQKDKEWSDFVI
jgi:hypothetical protein